jgi:hypothetical protein
VVTRGIVLASAWVTGAVDFRALDILGNLALLAALVVLGGSLDRARGLMTWALLFPIVLQPQIGKLMFYPMAAIQAFVGLLFSVLYLRDALSETRGYRSLAFYAIAVLTSGSGLILPLVGIPVLLRRGLRRAALVHGVIAVVAIAAYGPASSGLPYLARHPWSVAQFFLLVLGAVAQIPGQPWIQLVAGLTLLGYFVHVVRRGAGGAVPAFLFYLLLMVALVAVGRTSIYEGELWRWSLDGRYRVYSSLFLAICGVDVVHRLDARARRWVAPVVLGAALAFNLVWYAHAAGEFRRASVERVAAMTRWRAGGDVTQLPLLASPPQYAAANLTTAIENGVYRP